MTESAEYFYRKSSPMHDEASFSLEILGETSQKLDMNQSTIMELYHSRTDSASVEYSSECAGLARHWNSPLDNNTLETVAQVAMDRTRRRRRHVIPSFSVMWMLCWAILLGITFGVPEVQSQSVGVGCAITESKLEQCYRALGEADENGDSGIDGQDYLAFLNLMSGDYFSGVDRYSRLSIALRVNFVELACGCSSVNCCQGDSTIDIGGIGPGETPTQSQTTFLFKVCCRTFDTIEGIRTEPPTSFPTQSPTMVPTKTPTFPPTLPPTDVPTRTPTEEPTFAPTTEQPSTSPTTMAPTVSPTTTLGPSFSPSSIPTNEPTMAPTLFTGELEVSLQFNVSLGPYTLDEVRAALNNTVIQDMGAALRLLTIEVLKAEFGTDRLLRGRQLSVENRPNSSAVGEIAETPCNGLAGDGTACANISWNKTLFLVDEDRSEVRTKFIDAMLQLIASGRLNVLLRTVNPDTPIQTINAPTPPPPSPDEGPGISAITGGIIAAAVGAILIVAATSLYITRRHRTAKLSEDRRANELSSFHAEMTEDDIAVVNGNGVLGADRPHYGVRAKAGLNGFAALDDSGSNSTGPGGVHVADDESSNAGSSGWSSSAGVSSLNTGSNTGSVDSLGYEERRPVGATLGALGAASIIARNSKDKDALQFVPVESAREDGNSTIGSDNLTANSDDLHMGMADGDVPNLPNVSRVDLDLAIEAGDWAAVGATAALLATVSDSSSTTSLRSGSSRGGSTISSVDAARAAELDHLVDAGDWEGVVLAAAQFESNSSSTSRTESKSKSAGDGSVGTSSVNSPSVSTNVSESPSRAQKRAEIRTEVEALVRRVVPEELDHVDEMMLQFRGREEELVETLRTMQERSIAQRARAAVHRTAKREARQSAKSGGVPGFGLPPMPPRSGFDSGEDSSLSKGGTTSSSGSLIMQSRNALELAIEAGDWEKVGEAAAMIHDSSDSTGSGMTEDTPFSAARKLSNVKDPRAAELDKMIDKRDWKGVVSAAGRFTTEDTKKAADVSTETDGSEVSEQKSSVDDNRKPSGGESGSEKTKALQEEKDALAQAEIWMAIAAQSKQDGSTEPKGASDAADWAISRSLSALRSADLNGELADAGVAKVNGSSAESTGGESSTDKSV
eukprot:CAMPEP_0198294886 /NCGR_PEP_ID=MMETSP1449-20131203/24698_1 /TAXON_ID=420275 /ORGANISM="Attheya septentrionalis, Strain CCMP2084" /LENGTH=1129 /DNA_ID=CAMNT_0043994981 /DNA_START=295 /DNA_END=3684 /DNA_ORIENTATION=+